MSSYALMYILYALFIGIMAYAVLDKRWIKLMTKRFGDMSRDALITLILMLCFYIILVIPYLLSTTSLKVTTKDHFFLMKNIIIGAFMFFVMVVAFIRYIKWEKRGDNTDEWSMFYFGIIYMYILRISLIIILRLPLYIYFYAYNGLWLFYVLQGLFFILLLIPFIKNAWLVQLIGYIKNRVVLLFLIITLICFKIFVLYMTSIVPIEDETVTEIEKMFNFENYALKIYLTVFGVLCYIHYQDLKLKLKQRVKI